MFHKIQILPASIKNPISWNFSFTGGGQHIPAGLPYPPPPPLPHHHPGHCSSKFLQIMEWVFSASWVKLMKISCYRNIFCLFTTTSHYQCLGWRVGGNLSQLVYLTPHPRLWSSDCVQRMKMTSSATLVKIMKYLKIWTFPACLQQPVTRNALDDGWGATYPSWFILPPTHDFRALTGYDFVIAVNCFNNYKRICFTKYRYCLLV